jgi:hypothetical protein
VKQPWPDRLANRLYHRSIQCEDRLTPYPDARSSVDRAEVTAVTSPFHWPTWQENSATCPAPTTVPPARVRLTTAKSSLRRNRKLCLARPQGSASTSAFERWSPPHPILGLGLNLDLRRWSPPRPIPGLGLNLDLGRNRVLARPRPRPQEESPPRPTLGSDRPRHRGYIIALPLASSGYREQDRRPIWLASVNK